MVEIEMKKSLTALNLIAITLSRNCHYKEKRIHDIKLFKHNFVVNDMFLVKSGTCKI